MLSPSTDTLCLFFIGIVILTYKLVSAPYMLKIWLIFIIIWKYFPASLLSIICSQFLYIECFVKFKCHSSDQFFMMISAVYVQRKASPTVQLQNSSLITSSTLIFSSTQNLFCCGDENDLVIFLANARQGSQQQVLSNLYFSTDLKGCLHHILNSQLRLSLQLGLHCPGCRVRPKDKTEVRQKVRAWRDYRCVALGILEHLGFLSFYYHRWCSDNYCVQKTLYAHIYADIHSASFSGERVFRAWSSQLWGTVNSLMTYLARSVSFQYITCSENEGTLLYHAVERRMGRKAKICGCQGDVQNQTQVPSSPWKMGFISQAAAIVPGGFPGW